MEKQAPPENAARFITLDEPTLFAVMNEGGMEVIISEGDMLKRILNGGSQ